MKTLTKYKTPSDEAVYAADVEVIKQEKNNTQTKLPGQIEQYANGYGKLYYTTKFGQKTYITIGPPDFWVLKASGGRIYWMEWTIRIIGAAQQETKKQAS